MPDANDNRAPKKWTLMFYFAGDNPLAPSIISQLKALKHAGYHPDVNVVTQFDSQAALPHIFDVNLVNKIKKPNLSHHVGFGHDPFVRNLIEDKLWGEELNPEGKTIRSEIQKILRNYDPPRPGNGHCLRLHEDALPRGLNRNGSTETNPSVSLEEFLEFCLCEYKAEHYMLFILGHGMVVGNDVFLYDEHADIQSLTLRELGRHLQAFGSKVSEQKFHDGENERQASFDLVGFHCCSVSSLEVAYELQGTAKYMLASQGPAFVGSWPYWNILLRIMKGVDEHGSDMDVEELVRDITDYCYYNSMDYLLAGYSFDLCRCDLTNVRKVIERPLKDFSAALASGLQDPTLQNLILLAHWRSQSFYQEKYSDLYDFCLWVKNYCQDYKETAGALTPPMEKAIGACDEVMKALSPGGGLVVSSQYAGPAYQYSHGLSVFFPWAEPAADDDLWFGEDGERKSGEYTKYLFNRDTQWADFLQEYFIKTRRQTRKDEKGHPASGETRPRASSEEEKLHEDMVGLVYNGEGSLRYTSALKTNPRDGVGDCDCSTIKNFPRETRATRRHFPASKGFSFSGE